MKRIKEEMKRIHLHFHHSAISIPSPLIPYASSLLLLIILSQNHYPCLAGVPHVFIYAGCSSEKYSPNSPFESNRNSLLASMVSSSSEVAYNSFALQNDTASPPEATIYGLYQCRGDLKITECSKCIDGAANQISLVCPYTDGASLQLEGCYIRYENTDFLGKLDTGVRYKKCSRGVDNDVEFFRSRDDVLADLQTAVGFKVSSSGLVEGFAQCLGDLTPTDCGSCLAEAVKELKNLCGSAAAADVYLGQCYARYWASGYYDSSDSSPRDQAGKTIAIIVGVLGGVAILIILLSICRKRMG